MLALEAGRDDRGEAADDEAQARAAAAERWSILGVRTNAEVPGPVLRRGFRPGPAAMAPLRGAMDRGTLSVRGADRCLRVAWSIADLGGRTSPDKADVATALSFREDGAAR